MSRELAWLRTLRGWQRRGSPSRQRMLSESAQRPFLSRDLRGHAVRNGDRPQHDNHAYCPLPGVAPVELEDILIAGPDLPLHLAGNSRNQFQTELTRTRASCVARANSLPVLPSPGTGGRPARTS